MPTVRSFLVTTVLLAATLPPAAGADAKLPPKEGPLEPFLGAPTLELAQVFDRDRFPNVVVATDGSVLAVWGGVGLRRSTDGGRTWGEPIAIAPGFIDTDMTRSLDEATRSALVGQIASGRLGSAADVAAAVAFLASDAAAYITGETLHVNGGMYMGQ